MEGGSPAAIWQRWTLPMYYAQQRYWTDNPRPNHLLRMLVAVKYRLPRPRRTPKRARAVPLIDVAALHAPLTPQEMAILRNPGTPLR